jgi:hypothetical protein
MVENYFFEMSFVIHELARVLAPGGHVVMVNDNVQYVGEEAPVRWSGTARRRSPSAKPWPTARTAKPST